MPDTSEQTVLANLPSKTGRTLAEWFPVLAATGLEKHSELMDHLKSGHGVTHGFANFIVLRYRAQGISQEGDDLVDAQYAGARAGLRPVYDALVQAIREFGEDVEVAPKKSAVSVRRSKQFAVIEVASSKRIQVGIQLKGVEPSERLRAGNAMCSHKVSVTSLPEVDDELLLWLREAYARA